jgi:hypothetical protein
VFRYVAGLAPGIGCFALVAARPDASGPHRDRSPMHGLVATREARWPPSLRVVDGNRPVLNLCEGDRGATSKPLI